MCVCVRARERSRAGRAPAASPEVFAVIDI